jgi:insertion element IS1 protein InsB
VAAVCRESGLVVGFRVLRERSWEAMQELVDELPPAQSYCTDQFSLYADLDWPEGSSHIITEGKRDTHTIESLNANLRHYLGRLRRKSRCFSRCIQALTRAVRLFVWHYNRRQRMLMLNPHYRGGLALVF